VTEDDQAAEFRDLVAKARELGEQGIDRREIARRLEIAEEFHLKEGEAEQVVEYLLTREDVDT
jgi:hypothetical protein